ncbi:uncharacterized protein Nmlp_1340 [Natronomonas moolapensis 8.8.11]|uniref:DUF8139 domain-containing protein n=1 Tax=Natronomonas moolapensis (strain DSM 18674 / CECT 7526 / JCM 14361 / 8.8.11) TaxID=268739 RepID=M1XNM0_NATM8|nr:hypothetical protein [Natronomonas moolapensis]CCQ35548.1 uncharacterized protein Nmlp_1340 [Natronomonas moolapensis 8.8.11]
MTDDSETRPKAYEEGDRVRVQLSEADAESELEGTVCRVVHVFAGGDGEGDTASREIADASYRLEDVETEAVLPAVVRHCDVVPAGK